MYRFFCLAALLFANGLSAQPIAVFAKGDFVVLDPGRVTSSPRDPAKAAFLAAFTADLAQPAPFAAPAGLTDLPQWGRKVPGAGGTIQSHDSFRGGFVMRVSLHGLTARHRYILCLNGNPERPGNERLVDSVPGNEKERYYDFLTATSDANGSYQATFGIFLPPGPYDVRFYVKDTDDFKIVLYRDFFKFKVE